MTKALTLNKTHELSLLRRAKVYLKVKVYLRRLEKYKKVLLIYNHSYLLLLMLTHRQYLKDSRVMWINCKKANKNIILKNE